MKYVIYVGIAVLAVWALFYLIRHIQSQIRGDCGGGGCTGNCTSCGKDVYKRQAVL